MKPNILFLIIDSFRSDKFYGNDTSSQTPNIDDLVENGIFFPNNISAADGTILSLASMFTSLEPPKTGVKSEHYVKLDSDIINYFNLLKQEGFHAYATVPKIVSTLGILNMFENLDKTYDHFQSLSNGLGKKIIDQLNQKSMEEPWIYYVHINDIHFPIIPPKEFDKVEFGGSKYERMVSSIDPWLGKIIKNIDLKNTLVAITADHGSNIPTIKLDDEWISFETDGSRQKFITKVGNKVPTILEPVKSKSFFVIQKIRKKMKHKKVNNLKLTPYQQRSLFSQRGDPDHFLYDEKIKVPFLLIGAGINKKQIINFQVRTIDIFPTIFDVLGLKATHNVDGRSLLPLINGELIDELPSLILSSPLIEITSNDVIGLRTSEYKYFRDMHDSSKRIHLFDLKNDPLEEKNIFKQLPEIIQKFEKILQQKLSDSKQYNSEYSEEELKDVEKELKRMGYI